MRRYIHTQTHTRAYIYTHTRMHTYTHTNTYMHTHIIQARRTQKRGRALDTHTTVFGTTHTLTHMHAYTNIHRHTYTNIVYTHIDTYMQKHIILASGAQKGGNRARGMPTTVIGTTHTHTHSHSID
jgi:hypothetical protein